MAPQSSGVASRTTGTGSRTELLKKCDDACAVATRALRRQEHRPLPRRHFRNGRDELGDTEMVVFGLAYRSRARQRFSYGDSRGD